MAAVSFALFKKLSAAGERPVRGHAEHGWLDTFHTFSFADYYDLSWMGYRSLRVINDDLVMPGMGFGEHRHRDMEIITYGDKLGSGFTVSNSPSGDKFSPLEYLFTLGMQHGMVWVGPGEMPMQPNGVNRLGSFSGTGAQAGFDTPELAPGRSWRARIDPCWECGGRSR